MFKGITAGLFNKKAQIGQSKDEEVRPEAHPEIVNFNWDDCNPATNGEYFLIGQLARSWKTCLDIGANQGDYARKVRDVNPSCRIICFEPNPSLAGNIRSKGISEIHSMAMGDKAGSLSFHVNDADTAMSSAIRKGENSRTIDVPVTTIDDFCREHGLSHVDFVKIDTEGFELNVIRGAREMCSKRAIDMIQFEYGGTFADASVTIKDIYDILNKDYIICHVYPAGLIPYGYSCSIETYRYSNWVALSRGIFTG